jgi:hypothetical protein
MPEPTKTRVTSVTLSTSAQIWLSQYRSFKPNASVTVAVGDKDTLDDAIALGLPCLRKVYFQALRIEMELIGEAQGAYSGNENDLTDLFDYCVREIGDVDQHPTFSVEEERSVEANKETVQARSGAAGTTRTKKSASVVR